MFQFFFLSILTNFAAGVLLSADYFGRRIPRLSWLSAHPGSRRLKMASGAAALLVGLCTIFWPAGSGVPAFGDLVPSLAGMMMGVALLFEVFRQDALFPSEPAGGMGRTGLDWRSMLGIAGMAVAVLHFFLPERPFL